MALAAARGVLPHLKKDWPTVNLALDLPGFLRRTVMPSSDVGLVEAGAPGFTVGQLKIALSKIYARLGKRYATPFGSGPAPLGAVGTTPPVVVLGGVPVLGCISTAIAIVVAGALGTAAFVWSRDGGDTWAMAPALASSGTAPPAVTLAGCSALAQPASLNLKVTTAGGVGTARFQFSMDGGLTWTLWSVLAATGTAPPAVTVSGLSSLATPGALQVQILSAGNLGVALFRWSADGGTTWTGSVTAPSVPLPGTGLTLSFTAGAYSADNVYGGQGIPTASTVVLGGSGLSVAFAAGAYATDDVYVGQGFLTAALVTLGTTGLTAAFPAGPYALDNLYQSPTPVPEIVLGWMTTIVVPDVYRKRGVNPADPQLELVEKSRTEAWAEVKEAADSKDGLFDLPLNDAGTGSAVSAGGPLGYTETSPYVGFDREACIGYQEDSQGSGSGGFP